MRAASSGGTTESGSGSALIAVRVATSDAYSGGHVRQPARCDSKHSRTLGAELPIEVVTDLRAGLPAPHRDPCPDRRSGGVRQLRHEHHPPAPDPLLRAGQPDAHGLGDLRRGQPLGVVQTTAVR